MSDIIRKIAEATEYTAHQIANLAVDERNHWVNFQVDGAWVTVTLSADNKRVYGGTVRVFKQ